jgi:uncharacterized YccA/Bax inhibitor family protein
VFRSSSPALNDKTFGDYRAGVPAPGYANAMTIEGTATKTGILLLLVVLAAGYTWNVAMAAIPPLAESLGEAFAAVQPWVLGGGIGGFITAMVIIFKKSWAPFLSPVYAILEGLMLGGLSALFELMYPGIVFNAVFLTMGVLAVMLVAYRTGIIRATQKFKAIVICATGAIMLVYLVGFVMSFFGAGIPYIHDSGPIGIGFSLVVVGIAALNLILDFDLIEQGTRSGAPKYMEWYGGFALLVTLVWLYLEILRLLSKLRSRD